MKEKLKNLVYDNNSKVKDNQLNKDIYYGEKFD